MLNIPHWVLFQWTVFKLIWFALLPLLSPIVLLIFAFFSKIFCSICWASVVLAGSGRSLGLTFDSNWNKLYTKSRTSSGFVMGIIKTMVLPVLFHFSRYPPSRPFIKKSHENWIGTKIIKSQILSQILEHYPELWEQDWSPTSPSSSINTRWWS